MASVTAVTAGVVTGSLLLVVFGSIGALDLVGSLVLVVRFRREVRHQESAHGHEQRALLVIAIGMIVISIGTVIESTRHLVDHSRVRSSIVGSAVVGSSVVALGVLAAGKNRVGRRVDSRALVADSHVSMMGAVLAAFTLAGTITASRFGWWWIDPVGSLAVAFAGTLVAVTHVRHARGATGRS